MKDIINNLSKITNIPQSTLEDMIYNMKLCIAHEALSIQDEPIQIDIGIGKLSIGLIEGDIRYKFIPSSDLEEMVQQASNGVSPLIKVCEKSLTDKILNTYKTLF